MIEGTNKVMTVKEWFANKVAQEVKSNIHMCEVFAILKETEKAYYAMLNLGCMKCKTMWIPKSVVIAEDVTEQNKHKQAIRCESYDEAKEEFERHWQDYM